MTIEMNTDKFVCSRCGIGYSRRKGFFPVSYGSMHKGVGFLPYCRKCVDEIYGTYLAQCNDSKAAVRQTCRKLDLYWNAKIYESVIKKSSVRSLMTQYITRINGVASAGKSYDDTLLDEGTLWSFEKLGGSKVDETKSNNNKKVNVDSSNADTTSEDIEVPEDVVAFWGSGYSPEMYVQLEQRREYYTSKFPEAFSEDNHDIGSDVLMRQLCNLEVSISKDAAAGRSIDKSVNSLNTLIGSLNMKPTQKKDGDVDADMISTPMGVWLYRYEQKRPLPEVDEQLKDVNHVKKYVFTWLGHLVKLLGIKNGYTKLYDEEVNRLRVEKPEYADEDDENLLIDAYSEPYTSDGDADG